MYHYYVQFASLAKKGQEEKVIEGAVKIQRDEEITHFLEIEIIKEKIEEFLKKQYNYSHYIVFINSLQLLEKTS